MKQTAALKLVKSENGALLIQGSVRLPLGAQIEILDDITGKRFKHDTLWKISYKGQLSLVNKQHISNVNTSEHTEFVLSAAV